MLASVWERVKNVSFVLALRRRRYYRWFANVNSYEFPFYGVFKSVEEAARAAPPSRPVGHDLAEMAAQRADEMSRMATSDYPMVYWLAPLIKGGRVVFDFGGHLGTKYRAFSKYLQYYSDLRWVICDLPAVVSAGQRLCNERGETQPEYTTNFNEANGADVFIASGVLQFVERPLWEMLSDLRVAPAHVLVNKVSCRDGGRLVTLQNAKAAFVPYQILDWSAFVDGMASIGYRLIDEWPVLDRSCVVPFHSEVNGRHVGAYFRRAGEGEVSS